MELLSPAGGIKQLKAAVQSGADAVYLGGPVFGARYSAQNFTVDEMREMADYCHLYGVDVHVAVNTLIKETELPKLKEYLYTLNDIGADAIIIQDMGAARLAKKIIPDMPLHASTQMTVTSLEGVKYLEKAGFSRVVLARELSKEEIEYICKNAHIETEVFVHGAICMCYSGQCLMSSIIGGRSGNRGRCAQPCRLPYSLVEGDKTVSEGYLLSPKDMALIKEIKALERIGVTSLKIEGRLKRAEYVSAVTGIYRNYIDFPSDVSSKDYTELKNAFSRTGFTDGYFTSNLGRKMMSRENPSNAPLNTFSQQALSRAADDANIRKIPINITAVITKGEVISVTANDNDGHYASAEGDIPAVKADKRPIDEKRVREQLEKLGQTPFDSEDTSVFIESGITVPVSEINKVRRAVCEELIRLRTERKKGEKVEYKFPKAVRKSRKPQITCKVRKKEQERAAAELGIERIYGGNIAAAEPIFSNDEEIKTAGVLISNTAQLMRFKDKKLYGGSRLNIFNSMTVNALEGLETYAISPELNLNEIAALAANTDAPLEITGYGRTGLMLMKNCPVKASGYCRGRKDLYKLKDRKNKEFPLICHKNCICELINSVPVFIADKMDDFMDLGIDYICLDFTTENYEETKRIIKIYQQALNGEKVKNPFGVNNTTGGHYYRGVM